MSLAPPLLVLATLNNNNVAFMMSLALRVLEIPRWQRDLCWLRAQKADHTVKDSFGTAMCFVVVVVVFLPVGKRRKARRN